MRGVFLREISSQNWPDWLLRQALDNQPGVLIVVAGTVQYQGRTLRQGEVILAPPPVTLLGNNPGERGVALHPFFFKP